MKKIRIEFDTTNAAFEAPGEIDRILLQARDKIQRQQMRAPATHCDAPEAADVLMDSNGNTVGRVIIT